MSLSPGNKSGDSFNFYLLKSVARWEPILREICGYWNSVFKNKDALYQVVDMTSISYIEYTQTYTLKRNNS